MRRLILQGKSFEDGHFTITGEDFRHLSRVLRMKPGDEIDVALPSGEPATAIIERLTEGEMTIAISDCVGTYTEPEKEYVLIQALPKGQKMDYIVEKCTELGFTGFVPVLSERCVVREVSSSKAGRWQKLSSEAAKQSGRMKVPAFGQKLSSLEEAVASESELGSLLLFFWEGEKQQGLKDLTRQIGESSRICLIIGPEGGFSDEEAEKVVSLGGHPVSLGPRIFRSETAPVAAGAAVMYIAGDLSPQHILGKQEK